jgi:hypothetical protein
VIDTAPVPVAQVAAAPVQQPQGAEAASEAPEPKFVEAVSAPAAALQPTAAVAPAPEVSKPTFEPVIAEARVPTPVAMITAAAHEVTAAAAHEVSALVETVMAKKAPAPKPKPKARAASRRPVGPGDTVVQLGSYRSAQQVTEGWSRLTKRYPALRGYLPLKARFDSPNGTYWRLSIQGFANQREAIARCKELKSNGGKCFVRGFAGDAPVQVASR